MRNKEILIHVVMPGRHTTDYDSSAWRNA